MRRRLARVLAVSALAALAGALLVTGPVGARGKHHGRHHSSHLLKAVLKGASEVPGPGDSDGRGRARIRVKPSAGEVCFRLSWRNIADPTKAHIHRGVKGEAGDVVVTLFDGTATHRDCVTGLDEDLLRDIKRHPRQYYVNVHNADFPNGAVRGQLA